MNADREEDAASAPRPETICSRADSIPGSSTAPLVAPLSMSVVYRFESLDHVDSVYEGRAPGFVYARDGHPNAAQLAARVAALEGGEAAIVCASGMAASAVILLGLLDAGTHVAFADQLYGRTSVLIRRELARFGVQATAFDATDPESLKRAVQPNTRVVVIETISNPLLRVPNLSLMGEIAHEAGAALVVDHTFAPLLCRPLELGADLVYHSGTKLIGGHSDLTLGLAVGRRETIDRLQPIASTFGMTGNPFESWLAMRGIATLVIRVERTSSTAMTLAHRLSEHPACRAVHYPGLESHPDHERARSLFRGRFGAMLTLDLGDRARADALIRALKSVPFAPSLGDVATTLSHPATTSHRGQSAEDWARQGISAGLVRLSVGLEHPDDLWADFDRALASLSG